MSGTKEWPHRLRNAGLQNPTNACPPREPQVGALEGKTRHPPHALKRHLPCGARTTPQRRIPGYAAYRGARVVVSAFRVALGLPLARVVDNRGILSITLGRRYAQTVRFVTGNT